MSSEVSLPIKESSGESVEDRLTENVKTRVLPARYLKKDAKGNVIETPQEMFRRVAKTVAQPEAHFGNDQDRWEDTFFEMMTHLEFLPNSPTLMNAGTDIQQLSACFVMSPDDNLEAIFETVKRAARIFQSGGGVGYSFSQLRPRGDVVKETGGIASGPVSFMSVYDQMCETIKQGGRRRGAQMGILHVDHPDVGRFCVAKRDEDALTNFNISVAIDDEFITAVKNDQEYKLYNPRTQDQFETTEQTAYFYNEKYADVSPQRVKRNLWRDYSDDIQGIEAFRGDLVTVGEPMTLPARFIWRLLIDGAWLNGEPGIFVIDEANRHHAFDTQVHPEHRIKATNPCGEQPLEDFEACNLGHINLSLMVRDDASRWDDFNHSGDRSDHVSAFLDQAIDWQRLDRVIADGTRFLDNVITMSDFPLTEIENTVSEYRKIGLGVMGFAELLLQLGVRYGSDISVEIARQLMAHIDHEATWKSHELADNRSTFPAWDDSKYANPTQYDQWFTQHTGLPPTQWEDGFPIRNHGVTSIAPTGTTSMIGNTSPGCEPLYEVVYFKNVGSDVQGEQPLVKFDDYFLRVLEHNDYDVESIRDEAISLLQENAFEGPSSLSISDEIADIFTTAREISPKEHIDIQAAFQEHVDGAVSKTINISSDATRDAVEHAYKSAYEKGCKGITVYRSRSRSEQVLSTSSQNE
ncbi:MAG: adenosylcobalamin-dependent ribonucleoside-diphosphate reductase [Halobacteriaceae archaeon]